MSQGLPSPSPCALPQAALLHQLPRALACLAPSRASPLLQALSGTAALPTPVAPVPGAYACPHPTSRDGAAAAAHPPPPLLACALWQGLTSILYCTRPASLAPSSAPASRLPPSAAAAAAAAAADVYARLPLLPALLPGEVAWLQGVMEALQAGSPLPSGAAWGDNAGGGGGGGDGAGGGNAGGADGRGAQGGLLWVWAAAAQCLLALSACGQNLPRELTHASLPPSSPPVAAPGSTAVAVPTAAAGSMAAGCEQQTGGRLTQQQQQQLLRACQMRCLMVVGGSGAGRTVSGGPSSQDLAVCRAVCVEGGGSLRGCCGGAVQALRLLLAAALAAAAPQAAQVGVQSECRRCGCALQEGLGKTGTDLLLPRQADVCLCLQCLQCSCLE